MSRDNQKCPKCGMPSGYDDGKGYWPGGDLRICGRCKDNLLRRFAAFFGLQDTSSDERGITLEWKEMDDILSHIQRDTAMRISYIVTAKEMYERIQEIPTLVTQDTDKVCEKEEVEDW